MPDKTFKASNGISVYKRMAVDNGTYRPTISVGGHDLKMTEAQLRALIEWARSL